MASISSATSNATPGTPPANAPAEDEDKILTFRKRRLSLPLHHMSVDANVDTATGAGSGVGCGDNESSKVDGTLPPQGATTPVVPANTKLQFVSSPQTPENAMESSGKAHTFRKRRLSLTKVSQETLDANDNVDGANAAGDNSLLSSDSSSHTPHKRRRSSLDSVASSSNNTNTSKDGAGALLDNTPITFKSRTLHSGELVGEEGVPPPSPANVGHILYKPTPQPRHAVPDFDDAVPTAQGGGNGGFGSGDFLRDAVPNSRLKPRWKRRHTLSHTAELDKLPFAREVVGTYSCHGVEPVYESDDYEEDNDNDEALPQEQQQQQETVDAATSLTTETTTPSEDQQDTTQSQQPPVVPECSPEIETTTVTVAKINQDRGGVAFPYGNDPRTALFAVYDGHGQGGESVSQYALYEIQRRLEQHPQFKTDLTRAFCETFLAVDSGLQSEPLVDPLFAGTTACVALLQDQTLTLANAGDSRAVCARRCGTTTNHEGSGAASSAGTVVPPPPTTYTAIELTADQNPDLPTEMERILASGGYVTLPPAPGLSARVWLDPNCTQIGLAMARSIGDHAVSTVGVIAEPVVTRHVVTPEDEFLILASDGVWEFIDSERAVQIVGDNLHKGATKACQTLIESAAARWHEEEGAYRDDITAIVIKLQEVWRDADTAKTATSKMTKERANSVDAAEKS